MRGEEEAALQPGAVEVQAAEEEEEAALQPGAVEVQEATPGAAEEAEEAKGEQLCTGQPLEEEAAAQLHEGEVVYEQEVGLAMSSSCCAARAW